MPELPEVEITARRLGAALRGAEVESALAPGVNALKTYEPPLTAIAGRAIEAIRRRGKLFLIDFSGGLTAVIHLMSAGRLQLFDKRAGPRDRTSRVLIRIAGGRELRLREFGTRQAAWVKLLTQAGLADEQQLANLGPEAWPDPPAFDELLAEPRPLHSLLRDQRTIAGIGRSWVDEILHAARLSPFKRGDDLDRAQQERLRAATIETLDAALVHYERELSLPIPDKL
ncbi:MAG TPA: DNA-formamidopyrimidine glycosylase family protein, partial [Solirubrobacteraceae bacterium]|nr:DNA-formamidopyrimidine glycosylase family protein [Solirubrobacteraceae bacterium]